MHAAYGQILVSLRTNQVITEHQNLINAALKQITPTWPAGSEATPETLTLVTPALQHLVVQRYNSAQSV